MAEAALRIAIDGRELLGRPTGVGRYLLETLRCWEASGRHEFTIIVPASPPDDHLGLSDRFAWVVEPSDSAGTLWEQWRLPSALIESEATDETRRAGFAAGPFFTAESYPPSLIHPA